MYDVICGVYISGKPVDGYYVFMYCLKGHNCHQRDLNALE